MLTEQEKVDGRKHMGYLNVQQASTFVLGVPAGVQTQFVIEGAFTRLLAAAEPEYRRLIANLNSIEQQIVDNQDTLVASSIDEIKLRIGEGGTEDEFAQLIKRYKYWQGSLGNLLGVAPNPYDMRPLLGAGWGAASGINVTVGH